MNLKIRTYKTEYIVVTSEKGKFITASLTHKGSAMIYNKYLGTWLSEDWTTSQ